MADLEQSARDWLDEVTAAYADGGYASGDGPAAPVEEVEYLLAEVERLRDGIRRHNVLTMATIQRMAGDAAAQMDECSYHDAELWALLDEGNQDV